MAQNRGKQWENKIREDWKRTVPDSFIERIYDTVNGLIGVTNICDMIGYKCPNVFLIEAKSHEGNTFPLVNLTQYDKLIKKIGITGVRVGIVLWMIDHDRVLYVPIKTIQKMKEDGKKSVNINTIDKDGYRYIEIPSIKKRVFLDCDYSVLLNLEEGD